MAKNKKEYGKIGKYDKNNSTNLKFLVKRHVPMTNSLKNSQVNILCFTLKYLFSSFDLQIKLLVL